MPLSKLSIGSIKKSVKGLTCPFSWLTRSSWPPWSLPGALRHSRPVCSPWLKENCMIAVKNITSQYYQWFLVLCYNWIELASNAKASCCFWPLVRFFRGSKISGRQWSLVTFFRRLSCCLRSLITIRCWHLVVLEAKETLTFTLHLNSYWSLAVHLLFNWICVSILKSLSCWGGITKPIDFVSIDHPIFYPYIISNSLKLGQA